MISKEDFIVVHSLHDKGYSIRAIAKMTKLNRRTVAKRLKQQALIAPKRKVDTVSKLDNYKSYIFDFIGKSKHRIPCSAILEDIKSQGYTGGRSILQELLQSYYKERATDKDPVVRFETNPGVQMQVDWTTIRSGKNPIYAFVAVLGYSRKTFVYFVDNMTEDTLVRCHELTFMFFGGVPKTILYDNMKAVVLERNTYGKGLHKYNPELQDLAKKCGFEIRLCKPYRAKTKGKVERFNSYLKGNFYRPIVIKLQDSGLTVTHQILNERIGRWLVKANNRIHGTTKQIPSKVFTENEVKSLIPYITELVADAAVIATTIATHKPKRKIDLPYVTVQKVNLKQYDQLLTGASL